MLDMKFFVQSSYTTKQVLHMWRQSQACFHYPQRRITPFPAIGVLGVLTVIRSVNYDYHLLKLLGRIQTSFLLY